MILTYSILIVYILALIYIGLKDHKTEDKDGFIIADRKVGIIGTLSSLSASFRDGGGLVLWVGMGFAAGYKYYSLLIGLIIGFVIFSFMAPRIRRQAKKKNYVTVAQMIRDEVGNKAEKATSLIILLVSVLSVAIQFYVLGNITSMLLGIDPFNSILISALVVSFYVSSGGYKSIVRTDILQFFIMLSLWAFVFVIPLKAAQVLDFTSIYEGSSAKELVFGMLYTITIVFCMSDFWQRIFSSKSEKTAKRGVRLTGLAMLMMTLPLTFIGMSAVGIIPAGTGSNDVVMGILTSDVYPKYLISVFTLVGISITMSTLDTFAYVFSSTLLEGLLKVSITHNKKKYIYLSKFIMVSMLFVSAVLALTISNVVEYMLNCLSIFMVLSPLFFAIGAGMFKHKSKTLDKYLTISLLSAFCIGVYMFVQGYLTDFAMMMIPPALSAVFMTISYVIAKLQHRT